jgi:uncharacterized protein
MDGLPRRFRIPARITILDAQPLAQTPNPGPHTLARTRISAVLEIVLCSGIPSQLALASIFALAGFAPEPGQLSLGHVTSLLLLDAALVIGLIAWFLRRQGERPVHVFLGSRPVKPEILLGIPMTAFVFVLALTVLSVVRLIAPSLQNPDGNPFEQLLQTPTQALVLGIVATISGGFREEIQRAFILHRFEQYLGGAYVGLVLYSLLFGLYHSFQGWDAVPATAMLGAFWGAVYIARRSIIAPVVSHSGFNAAEIVLYVLSRR